MSSDTQADEASLTIPTRPKIGSVGLNGWPLRRLVGAFAAGLVLYWAVSNLLSVIQQAVIMRMMNVPIYLFAPEAAKEHVDSHARATADVLARVKSEKAEAEDAEKGTSK